METLILFCVLFGTLMSVAASSSEFNLTCYDCLYYSKRVYYVDDCQSDVTRHDDMLQPCKKRDSFCKIERTTNHGITIRFERSCAETCIEECRWKGIVSMQMICTKCCQHNACNV